MLVKPKVAQGEIQSCELSFGMAYSKDLVILKRFSNWFGVAENSYKVAF